MVSDYFTVTVDNNTSSDTLGNTYTTGGYYDLYGIWHPYTWPYTYNWSWTYPVTVYKYQITCPKCKTNNWLELDKITVCTKAGCGAKLKAVTNQADYEVPVNA